MTGVLTLILFCIGFHTWTQSSGVTGIVGFFDPLLRIKW
jgi:hypothetical protein